jgi:hypothetical protein
MTPPTPKDEQVSKWASYPMMHKLHETDRMGVILLCADLEQGGCHPSLIEHVRELVIARTLSVYVFAENCRTNEDTIKELRASYDALKAERDAAVQRLAAAERIAKAAQEYIEESPCDPDITARQQAAWIRYRAAVTEGPQE